jgi:lipopolysaccharide transport system ATP-binding protein
MSDTVIQVENLWKEYRLGTINHGTLSQDLQSWWAKLRGKEDPNSLITAFHQPREAGHRSSLKHHFLALNNVSFEVKQGETLGIIGRNGAGKSTLLKILSSVTAPTSGEVKIKGRVSSLLEVGTGFHSELTGRENIYLNGAILGMRRTEIKRKFDEIVAFADVDEFIDTPVKRYSSGMYVRLAFAVAAHLESEILIVDEVLAVGDAEFQKKCMKKMKKDGDSGRTVLFVSHNMAAIRGLCNKGMLLDAGRLDSCGSLSDTLARYEKKHHVVKQGIWINEEKTNEGVYLKKITVCDANNRVKTNFLNSESIRVMFYTNTAKSTDNVKVGFDLIKQGAVAFRSEQIDSLKKKSFLEGERNVFVCEIPGWFLNVGEYSLRPLLSIHCVKSLTVHDEPVLSFKVDLNPEKSEFHNVLNENNHPGSIFPLLNWYLF